MLTQSFNGKTASNWSIQIPLTDLVALQELPSKLEDLEIENKQLRRELETLRCLYSQTLEILGDIRRDYGIRGRQAG